jgi:hypothetical protein
MMEIEIDTMSEDADWLHIRTFIPAATKTK